MNWLRRSVIDLFQVGVDAADPSSALRLQCQKNPFPEPRARGRTLLIAIGKAAVPMMRTALTLTSHAQAIVVTNYENRTPLDGAVVFGAGHPVPDENGAAATRAIEDALQAMGARDQVIALISGGGSALLVAPSPGLSLEDKILMNQLLLRSGLAITEMNLIRQHLSRLKGGGLLQCAAPAPVTAYILSDVIGNDVRAIASGPTAAPIGTRGEAVALLKSNNLWQALPCAVHDHLIRPAPDAPHIPVAENHIIGSNHQSLEAIRTRAIAENWGAEISARWLVGDVAEACDVIMQTAQSASKEPRRCFIFGGETTVKLRGDGVGGRNQELALRVAMALAGHARDWVFLSGGTDGRDGPTHAAGGIVDGGTLARLRVQGRDPQAMLFKNDSHTALVAAGDALITGATGTNVADIQILLLE